MVYTKQLFIYVSMKLLNVYLHFGKSLLISKFLIREIMHLFNKLWNKLQVQTGVENYFSF